MIVTDQQLGSLNYTTPKVIIVEVTPSPYAQAASTNVIGVVGQAVRGKSDKLYSIGSLPEFERKLGFYKAGMDGYLFCKNVFDANGSIIKFAIAAATGRMAATFTMSSADTVPVALGVFTVDSEGSWGNNVEFAFSNNAVAGYFNLTVRNRKSSEITSYIKVTTDVEDARYIGAMVAQDARKFFTLVMSLSDGTKPDVTVVANAIGGSDGSTTVPDTAYIGIDGSGAKSGIQLFKNISASDTSIVVSARLTSSIITALLVHVQDIKLSPRRTIICFPVGTTVTTALANMTAMDTDKAKFVFPNLVVENPFTLIPEVVNPTSFEAANDTLLGYYQSASQTRLPDTVKDSEIELDPTDVDSLTAHRINPFVFRNGRGFIRASDYTASSNPSLSENVVRKAKDFFARTYDDLLQNYLDKPITPQLWSSIKKALDGFCSLEAQAGHIGLTNGGIPYNNQCDKTNNPHDVVVLKKILIYSQIALLAPANIIELFLDAQLDKQITTT